MNFSQFINQAQLKQRVGSLNPIFALLSIIGIGLMSIVLLPFLIVFAVVSFIGLNLLGRKYLAPKMQPIFGQQAQNDVYRDDPNIQRERSVYQSDMFKQTSSHAPRSGRTFEHQAD